MPLHWSRGSIFHLDWMSFSSIDSYQESRGSLTRRRCDESRTVFHYIYLQCDWFTYFVAEFKLEANLHHNFFTFYTIHSIFICCKIIMNTRSSGLKAATPSPRKYVSSQSVTPGRTCHGTVYFEHGAILAERSRHCTTCYNWLMKIKKEVSVCHHSLLLIIQSKYVLSRFANICQTSRPKWRDTWNATLPSWRRLIGEIKPTSSRHYAISKSGSRNKMEWKIYGSMWGIYFVAWNILKWIFRWSRP